MLPIKKILCPTDFSEPSHESIATAKELAEHFAAELHVVTVVEPVPVMAAPPAPMTFNVLSYQKELEAAAKRDLENLVQSRIPDRIAVRKDVLLGPAAHEIVRYAEEECVDMIIIASHGRTGIQRFLFGSVAEKVARLAACPVLIIHAPQAESNEE
ncbi:universal stress protein [Candidatus Fermentibacteria bacterium]|nr:universal stress protein [Candidatus Fermentibacteria bacterium]